MPMPFNKQFLLEAILLSRKAIEQNDGGPFGCVVVKDGKIIATGHNRVTSSNDPTAHAEVVAIRNACNALGTFQLSGCDIYTSCEPCPMCLGAIYWARPEAVYFANTRNDAAQIGFDDAFIYDEINFLPQERKIRMLHCPDEQAAKIFELWKLKEDKTRY